MGLSASLAGRFTPGERATGSHWIEGGVDPRAGLDDVEKRKFLTLPGHELSFLGRLDRIFLIIIIWFVRLLALRPLLAYCASLG
jgi:hypothetical protein